MAIWLDEKYITTIGLNLRHFHRQSRTTFTFRCPFCGDSQRNVKKTRGYFFLHNRNYFFKCHNCNEGMSLRVFLKKQAPDLYNEYQLDRLRQERPDAVIIPSRIISKLEIPKHTQALTIPTIASLPDDHLAKQYCFSRGLPLESLNHLYFTNQWTEWIKTVGWSYILPEDNAPRLIIPWFDRAMNSNNESRILGAQARRLDVIGKEARYITLKDSSIDETLKVYGSDRVDFHKQIYVVEGPLDSWFLPNCLAAMGSDLLRIHDSVTYSYDAVYIWDNEPRNKDLCKILYEAIIRGLKVVIWPKSLQEKDLNDMSQAGLNVLELVKNNTYQGLRAELEYSQWKN
jgi:transcription elongation factor Elf1